MEHPYEIKCYMVPDSIIKLGAKLLLACYSAKFIDSISEASITHKKGWYQFKYFRNGLPLTQSISEDGSMYRNTPKYYHKNRLTKLKKPLQGFIKDV